MKHQLYINRRMFKRVSTYYCGEIKEDISMHDIIKCNHKHIIKYKTSTKKYNIDSDVIYINIATKYNEINMINLFMHKYGICCTSISRYTCNNVLTLSFKNFDKALKNIDNMKQYWILKTIFKNIKLDYLSEVWILRVLYFLENKTFSVSDLCEADEELGPAFR